MGDSCSLFSLFFANYQPSMSPSPQKSWAPGGLANEKSSGAGTLGLLLICEKRKS
jgi:hypothetical protein